MAQAESADAVIKSLPQLVKVEDVNAIAALRAHGDKKVRKAVRKAIHQLRSRGIDVPDAPAQSWSAGTTLEELRGDLTPVAMLETRGLPGATRIMISEPNEDGGVLLAGVLGPDDRVLDFQAYHQTDGQRARLRKDWQRTAGDRVIPVDWVRARVRWAREQTVRGGRVAPQALDDQLPRLGPPPHERPPSFLVHIFPEDADLTSEVVDDMFVASGAVMWPPLVDMEDMLKRLAKLHSTDDPDPDDDRRKDLVAQACAGDAKVSRGLSGPVADLFDDTAVGLWVEGEEADARVALAAARAMRETSDPSNLPWVHAFLGFQVAAVARSRMGHDHDHEGHSH